MLWVEPNVITEVDRGKPMICVTINFKHKPLNYLYSSLHVPSPFIALTARRA